MLRQCCWMGLADTRAAMVVQNYSLIDSVMVQISIGVMLRSDGNIDRTIVEQNSVGPGPDRPSVILCVKLGFAIALVFTLSGLVVRCYTRIVTYSRQMLFSIPSVMNSDGT